MKYLLIACLFLASCTNKTNEKLLSRFDTLIIAEKYIPIHDTLVIIQTIDSVPYPNIDRTKPHILSGGYQLRPIKLFNNGKTVDTIIQHKIVHY